MSSRKLGGSALIGCTVSTVPSDGISQFKPPLLLKPRSRSCAALSARTAEEGAPSTTAMRRLPLRVAEATRLNPDAQIKPVFMPSAPG